MADRNDLLFEIGTEELPPTALDRLSIALAEGFAAQLFQHQLSYDTIERFASPRRLALRVRSLTTSQPDQEIVRKGPTVQSAFDAQGQPTPAALGFARACGVDITAVAREDSPKGAWLIVRQFQPGRPTSELLIPLIERTLAGLPIPKRMRWGEREEEFVRPVHWVVLLFGSDLVPGTVLGVPTGRDTFGHRFHRPGPIRLSDPGDYDELLRETGRVEPDFARRRELIRNQVVTLAAEAGGEAMIDADLLDEVTALCEWPRALLGGFDARYLEVPPEVLIETMRKNQKYFPLHSPDGALLPSFITIANIESLDPSQVRAGNERVIRPRFADAAFFWSQDLKQPLSAFAERLTSVVFQDQLGTLAEKSLRVGQIGRYLAGLLDYDEELVARAAHLAKCDLMTAMIFEFAGLQGIMGRYYAQNSGEDPAVCAAMEEQYLPRHAGDRLPASECGRILALAERLDSLVGIFAIGLRPTGVKDPYALRRAAIGVLRLLIETPLELNLRDLLEFTAQELRGKVDATSAASEVFDYILERLKSYCQDQDLSGDVVEAVLAVGGHYPTDLFRRMLAVQDFKRLPEADALAVANKRTRNILKKSGEITHGEVRGDLLVDPAEGALAARLDELAPLAAHHLVTKEYGAALKLLAGLRPEVDAFFDQVMVLADDEKIRANRLALLARLEGLFLGIADISRLQPIS